MERTPVTSSQLASVGYDPGTQTLEIEFNNHRGGPTSVYQYDNVPPETHTAMMKAPSQGSYFYANIKGKFAYRKVS